MYIGPKRTEQLILLIQPTNQYNLDNAITILVNGEYEKRLNLILQYPYKNNVSYIELLIKKCLNKYYT